MKFLPIVLLVAAATASSPRRRARRLFQAPQCADSCIELYAPVCGTDGVTYDNVCFLEKYACENFLEISVASQGVCPTQSECSTICPAIYAPVCGSDGVTYSNACSLGVENCLRAEQDLLVEITSVDGACGASSCAGFAGLECEDGFSCVDVATDDCDPALGGADCIGYCQPEPQSNCPTICPAIYAPVCGSDGVTYSNPCALGVENCLRAEDGQLVEITSVEGACGASSCAGFAGLPCDEGFTCVDVATDDCDPEVGGSDCIGYCQPVPVVVSNCLTICPAIYAPVCGSDGLTYPSACVLGVTNCVRAEQNLVEITYVDGECGSSCAGFAGLPCPEGYTCTDVATDDCDPEFGGADCIGYCQPEEESSACDFACTQIYAPVCGSNGVNYGNECEFDRAKCLLPEDEAAALTFTEGECGSVPPSDCLCIALYAPVCGTDGVSYGNSCYLGCAAANSATVINVACQGECPCSECDVPCTKEYNPVCGSDGVTYGNPCTFGVAACHFAEDNFGAVLTSTPGECKAVPEV